MLLLHPLEARRLRDAIFQALYRREWSQRQLAHAAGLAPSAISKLLDHTRPPALPSLIAVARALPELRALVLQVLDLTPPLHR